ncbi:uncharacterized protein ARMOST_11464 [Armillaria ostoyae]|uniref:Uncharacterized protein n=1 Tax=Armillaria ostoyae TaxID=47428 RepID=A0A284RH82_ARMOS|nr:uncharacterized protein ARMOST_11464 [Armillaria ostoyae]
MQPVSTHVEQGGGNVGEMGWRPLLGRIAALWAQTIGAIVSSDIENGYLLKTRLVEAVIKWGGIDVGRMGPQEERLHDPQPDQKPNHRHQHRTRRRVPHLLGFFIALAWRERILPFLYDHGILIRTHQRLRPQQPAPFPAHYVLPYASTEQLIHEQITTPPAGLQQRPPFHANLSDEFPLRPPPPQRNATPGPSGTRQTPMPPPSSSKLETNDRDLRARYEQFPPPTYDPADIPPPERALLPIQPRPIMGFPTLPPGRIFIRPAMGEDPWPTDDSSDDDAPWNHPAPDANQLLPPQQFILIDSDDEDLDALEPPQSDLDVPESVSDVARTLSPPPRPLAFTYRSPTDPLNLDGPDFEWNELSAVDILILGPHRTAAWELHQ